MGKGKKAHPANPGSFNLTPQVERDRLILLQQSSSSMEEEAKEEAFFLACCGEVTLMRKIGPTQ